MQASGKTLVMFQRQASTVSCFNKLEIYYLTSLGSWKYIGYISNGKEGTFYIPSNAKGIKVGYPSEVEGFMETDRIYFSHLDEVLFLVGKAHFNLFKGHPFLFERNDYLNMYIK
jgi:hypothetical protein